MPRKVIYSSREAHRFGFGFVQEKRVETMRAVGAGQGDGSSTSKNDINIISRGQSKYIWRPLCF